MKKTALLILIISVFVLGCKKDEPEPEPTGPSYQIVTGTASGITNTAATVTGSVSNLNGISIIAYGHVWSTSANPSVNLTTKTTFGPTNADTTFTSNLSMLQQATTYYVRAYTTDSQGTYYGATVTITTASSFFEFVVSSTYLQDDEYWKQRLWVMIYDANNTLSGIQEVFNGDTYAFEWPANNKAGDYKVQLFRYTNYVNPDYSDSYNLSCYVNLKPEVWYLGSEPVPNTYTQIGTNMVTLTDVNIYTYDYWSVQNIFYDWYYDSNTQTFEFFQYFNPDKIWISYYNEGEAPHYKWFGNVGLNENFTISSADFTQMTSSVNLVLPQNYSSYVYVETEDDLTTDYWEWFDVFYRDTDSMTVVPVYYPSELFSGYYTYISLRSENTYETMVKYRGTIPAQFYSLPVNVTTNNEAISNFSASFTGEADIYTASWNYYSLAKANESFNYFVYGSSDDISTYSAPALPVEITALNEALIDLDNLTYSSSIFREYNYISGYSDYIMHNFVQPNYDDVNYQYYYAKTIYKDYKKTKIEPVNDREEIKRMKQNSLDF